MNVFGLKSSRHISIGPKQTFAGITAGRNSDPRSDECLWKDDASKNPKAVEPNAVYPK